MQIKVTVTSTRTAPFQFTTEARDFAGITDELSARGLSPAEFEFVDMKTHTSYSLGTAVLPEQDFVLIAHPRQPKGGADLSYNEKKSYIKNARLTAVNEDIEELMELIPNNYSSLPSEKLDTVYQAVYNFLNPVTTDVVEEYEDVDLTNFVTRDEFNLLKNRIIQLEIKNQILNDDTAGYFSDVATKLA